MEQELISNKSIAIIGAGPAGCICAYHLINSNLDVSLFEKSKVLKTILPTGGGKCNLAHAQYDFKELAKNYPRGEKFLYSIFSQFSTQDTIDLFKKIGIDTYTRDDNRIFPTTNSSSDVRAKIINAIKNTKIINENVEIIEHNKNFYKIKTNKSTFAFDIVIVAIGGHSGLEMIKNLDINTIEQTPSLVGYKTQKDYKTLAGVSIKNVKYKNLQGDILFTHKGISGPLIYTISSLYAKNKFPYTLAFKLTNKVNLQDLLNKNPHKEIKNLLGQLIPKSVSEYILKDINIEANTPCHAINGKQRDEIYNKLQNFEIEVIEKISDSEVVSCGGVDLKEINPKTLEAKKYKNLYFCGEILDIDGFCGGFNLQNCWSTGFVVAKSIKNTI